MTATTNGYSLRHPQTTAWGILLASFLALCSLCAVTTAGARWFLLESEVGLTVRLTVSRGRVDLRLPDGTDIGVNRDLVIDAATASFETDSTSQGYLTFEDTYSQQIVARVFLLQDTSATLVRATRPRFDFSSNPYHVLMESSAGKFLVQARDGANRPTDIQVRSNAGAAQVDDVADVRAEITGQDILLKTNEGSGLLVKRDGETRRVQGGQQGALRTDPHGAQAFDVQFWQERALNASFGSTIDVETNPALPIGWACTSQANRQNEPQGSVTRQAVEGQAALRLERAGQGLDHAESRCTYSFETAPRVPQDVTPFTSLAIRGRLQILGQDVTTCGIQGSECPIMLELEYLAAGSEDTPSYWRHGFYAVRPTADTNPLSCDTCLQEHERLTSGAWYIYDSGDLFRLLPENRRPVRITRLSVYASGHAYDALVTDLQVVAGQPQ
ncbi:MAG: hypothetical protein IT323_00500 [Anaerolineae bacterium]|nr:hypothetical protein [Anaerolineae bacterium]